MHAIFSHFSSRVCLSFVSERARAYIGSEKSGDGRRRNFVLSLRMASRIVSSFLLLPLPSFDWTRNRRRWSSNVIRLNQTFPSSSPRYKRISGAYSISVCMLEAPCLRRASFRSYDPLSGKPRKSATSSQSELRPQSNDPPRCWYFIKSPRQQISLISAFQLTSCGISASCLTFVPESICTRILFRLIPHS